MRFVSSRKSSFQTLDKFNGVSKKTMILADFMSLIMWSGVIRVGDLVPTFRGFT